jgi:anti-sigma regulatory factor (Ser/Thr protein kinase)
MSETIHLPPASKLLPGQVRALLKAFLRERETALHLEPPDDFISDVILAAAELTNNAVAHAPCGERVTLRARIEEARSLWAGVWDCSPETPVAKPVIGPDGMPMLDEYGCDLGITLALAAELNVPWTPPAGKWTWV